MVTLGRNLRSLWIIAVLVLGWMVPAPGATGADALKSSPVWSIRASKDAYYPGEPVPLVLRFSNSGPQQEEVHFADDLEVSSVEVRNISGEVLATGATLNRPEGGPRPTLLGVAPGQASDRPIVLNRWCSTLLLPAGRYEVVVRLRYFLRSESQVVGQRAGVREFKSGPAHLEELKLKIGIAPMDLPGFKDVLEGLRQQAFPTVFMEKIPTPQEEYAAREMLALTESTLAVPYQLEILAGGGLTYGLRWDAIESLARSKTLGAATGLMRLVEKPGLEHVTRDLVEAVYRIRESGQAEIIAATDEFIQKHERQTVRQRVTRADTSK